MKRALLAVLVLGAASLLVPAQTTNAVPATNAPAAAAAANPYPDAIAANRVALQLDHDCAAARQNLLAGWNNWALALAARGDFAGALEKIDAGLALEPDYEPLLDNRVYIQTRRQAGSHRLRPVQSL